ncbi:MAG: hypothetical protein GXP62_09920, partial [Oligoflexia bacterium]|nr:hypothetical protein [Oligoflexia bacterium]
MRSLTSALLALPLVLLAACEPVVRPPSPGHGGEIHLRTGSWQVEVIDVALSGRCEGTTARDLIGQRLMAQVALDPDGRARVNLEGVQLRGRYDGSFLEVAGFVDAEASPGPMTDTVTQTEP